MWWTMNTTDQQKISAACHLAALSCNLNSHLCCQTNAKLRQNAGSEASVKLVLIFVSPENLVYPALYHCQPESSRGCIVVGCRGALLYRASAASAALHIMHAWMESLQSHCAQQMCCSVQVGLLWPYQLLLALAFHWSGGPLL